MNHPVRQSSQLPSQAQFSSGHAPMQFSVRQSTPPQTQPNFSPHQYQQPATRPTARVTQTQSFTSLDGWHSYDPSEAHKAPQKKTKNNKKSTKPPTGTQKQVRIPEPVPANSAQHEGSGRSAATPPVPASTCPTAAPPVPDPIRPAGGRSSVPNPNTVSASAPSPIPMPPNSMESPTPPHSSRASATRLATSAAPRRLPHRGNLPLPDGRVPLTFCTKKTPEAEREFWHSLSLIDQQRVTNIYHEGNLQTATFTLGSADPTPHPQGQASSGVVPSENHRKGKGKEKELATEDATRKAPSESADRDRSKPSRTTAYQPATVEDVPEESDGGLSYASDSRPQESDRHPPMETRPRRTPPPFAVSSEDYYGSTHMSVKVLDAFHQTQERLDRLEGKISCILRTTGHQVHPARSKQSSARRRRPEAHPPTRSHLPSRQTHGDSDADDEDADEDEDDEDAEDQDDNDNDEEDEDGDEDEDEDDERALQELKALAREVKDKAHKTRHAEIVRKYMDLKLLKFSHTSELPTMFPRLTDKELSDYRANKYPPFSEEHFRICFVRQWIRCSWNFGAREFVVNFLIDICQRKAFTGVLTGPPLPRRFFTQKAMEKAVDSHVEYLRGQYKDHAGPLTPTKEAKLKKRKQDSGINRRKKTTLEARERTANRHGLVRHAALLKKLEPCHMSGDEAATTKPGAEATGNAHLWFP
ncbi:hypothetical protein GSI_08508 [Ganoderma sinense ZZ0214-1]|uniref:Uncharacterized protein n=1 Tax=Ganoderma sinense ZZ0214-1 TaxID=1077348 RepID=A0A2G8S3X2_9APHY|nr:hypothetical protein GSI_08508 [Ganoderma sinense ZZ0214-1]